MELSKVGTANKIFEIMCCTTLPDVLYVLPDLRAVELVVRTRDSCAVLLVCSVRAILGKKIVWVIKTSIINFVFQG